MNLDRIEQQAGHLPAYQIADSVNEALMESANLVITAPPGAGKSTLLPLTILRGMSDQALEGFIHNHLKSQGKILMLEPRRLADCRTDGANSGRNRGQNHRLSGKIRKQGFG